MIKASAPGKVILWGEHAVVYDKLGIATAVDKRCSVKIDYNKDGNVLIDSKGLGLKEYLSRDELFALFEEVEDLKKKKDFDKLKEVAKKDKLTPSFFVTAGLMRRYGFKPVEVSIETEVPKNLGSSSSIFSALSLGVSKFLGKDLSKKDISDFAYEGDVIAHGGLPSGIDTSIVTFGGYIQYKKSEGVKPLDVRFELPLIFTDSGEPAKTSEAVHHVRKQREENQKYVDQVLDRLDNISIQSLNALGKQNIEIMGKLMTDYYSELRKLDVSTKKLDEIIEIAIENNALGAKPTGGWCGGCCIVLAKDQRQAEDLIKIYKNNGFNSFQTKIGVEGVREIK
jgi:mevalonate kinase